MPLHVAACVDVRAHVEPRGVVTIDDRPMTIRGEESPRAAEIYILVSPPYQLASRAFNSASETIHRVISFAQTCLNEDVKSFIKTSLIAETTKGKKKREREREREKVRKGEKKHATPVMYSSYA